MRFVKIDVEGAEAIAVAGMHGLLSSGRILNLAVEITPDAWHRFASIMPFAQQVAQLADVVNVHGYRAFTLFMPRGVRRLTDALSPSIATRVPPGQLPGHVSPPCGVDAYEIHDFAQFVNLYCMKQAGSPPFGKGKCGNVWFTRVHLPAGGGAAVAVIPASITNYI